MLTADPNTGIMVDVRPHYSDGGKVTDRFKVQYSINGADPIERVFKNV